MKEAERLAGVLDGWSGFIGSGYECPAAGQPMVEAATLLRAQSARIAALEDALREIEEGKIERPILWTYREDGKPSKHDRCIHDVWMYETCEGCIDAHITKALGKGSE